MPQLSWDQDISSSGHKFELPKKSNLCPHPHISQASIQCWIFILSWLKYMYDVPLTPVYNWPHQVVRYQVTHFSVLLLWPWLPPPPPHGCQRASGETWKSSLNTFVQLTLPRMAYQIMWLSLVGDLPLLNFGSSDLHLLQDYRPELKWPLFTLTFLIKQHEL